MGMKVLCGGCSGNDAGLRLEWVYLEGFTGVLADRENLLEKSGNFILFIFLIMFFCCCL